MIKCNQQDMLVTWLCERIKVTPTAHMMAIGSCNAAGELLGVAGYDNFTGSSCEMHMAGSPGWLTKEFLHFAFFYPFIQLNYKVVLAQIPSGNQKAIDMDKRMGWKEVCIIPDAHPDGALHIFVMRREECKWLGVKHGQEEQRTAPA